jgi:hypothetical protein
MGTRMRYSEPGDIRDEGGGTMIRRVDLCHAIAVMLAASVCVCFSTGTTAVALPVTPSPTPGSTTPTLTPEGTITPTPTLTPTCAPTGTPYCSDHCVPCPTVRPNCYRDACGWCIQNPSCGFNEVCVPSNEPYHFVSGCCSCATVTPTPTPTPTPTEPCSALACTGTCGYCPPCTPGSICPSAACEVGHCEVVSGSCTCVLGIVTPTPTPTRVWSTCIGDCDGSGAVAVNELVLGVNIALGSAEFSACPAFDCNSDCHPGPIPATPIPSVDVACLIRGVNNALDGCPPPICTSDADCDDGNGCSVDQCTIDGCTHQCVCD